MEECTAEGDDFTYVTEELSIFASEVVAPIKATATGVACAAWNRLSSSLDDNEIQRNLKAFAQSHHGTVMTPLGDEELASEVRYQIRSKFSYISLSLFFMSLFLSNKTNIKQSCVRSIVSGATVYN